MIKTIEVNDHQSFDVNSAAGWLFIYRSQFGRDILPDLLPMVEGVLDAIVKLMPSVDIDTEEISVESFTKAFNEDTISDLLVSFGGLEAITFINILWAMAKNADKKIKPPQEWVNQFETFPLDTIVPELFELIIASSMSTKNASRLANLKLKTKDQ